MTNDNHDPRKQFNNYVRSVTKEGESPKKYVIDVVNYLIKNKKPLHEYSTKSRTNNLLIDLGFSNKSIENFTNKYSNLRDYCIIKQLENNQVYNKTAFSSLFTATEMTQIMHSDEFLKSIDKNLDNKKAQRIVKDLDKDYVISVCDSNPKLKNKTAMMINLLDGNDKKGLKREIDLIKDFISAQNEETGFKLNDIKDVMRIFSFTKEAIEKNAKQIYNDINPQTIRYW